MALVRVLFGHGQVEMDVPATVNLTPAEIMSAISGGMVSVRLRIASVEVDVSPQSPS